MKREQIQTIQTPDQSISTQAKSIKMGIYGLLRPYLEQNLNKNNDILWIQQIPKPLHKDLFDQIKEANADKNHKSQQILLLLKTCKDNSELMICVSQIQEFFKVANLNQKKAILFELFDTLDTFKIKDNLNYGDFIVLIEFVKSIQTLDNYNDSIIPILVSKMADKISKKQFLAFFDFCTDLYNCNAITLNDTLTTFKKCLDFDTDGVVFNWLINITNATNINSDSIESLLNKEVEKGRSQQIISLIENKYSSFSNQFKSGILKHIILQGEFDLVYKFIDTYFIRGYLDQSKPPDQDDDYDFFFEPICTDLAKHGYADQMYQMVTKDVSTLDFYRYKSLFQNLAENGYAEQIADQVITILNSKSIPKSYYSISGFVNDFYPSLLKTVKPECQARLLSLLIDKIANQDIPTYNLKPYLFTQICRLGFKTELFNLVTQTDLLKNEYNIIDKIFLENLPEEVDSIKAAMSQKTWEKLIELPLTLNYLIQISPEFEASLASKFHEAFENILKSDILLFDLGFKKFTVDFAKVGSFLSSETIHVVAQDIFGLLSNRAAEAELKDSIISFFTRFIKKGFAQETILNFKQNPYLKDSKTLLFFLQSLAANNYIDEALEILDSISISTDLKKSFTKQILVYKGKTGFIELIDTKIQNQLDELKDTAFIDSEIEASLDIFKGEVVAKIQQMNETELFFINNFLGKYSVLSPELGKILTGKAFVMDFEKEGSELKIARLANKDIVFVNQIKSQSYFAWKEASEAQVHSDQYREKDILNNKINNLQKHIISLSSARNNLGTPIFQTKYIPVAPIFKATLSSDDKVQVRSIFCGISFERLSLAYDDPIRDEILAQTEEIEYKLSKLGISHGHTHQGNYVIELINKDYIESEAKNGRNINNLNRIFQKNFSYDLEDYRKDPDKWELVVRLIDWDQAKKI